MKDPAISPPPTPRAVMRVVHLEVGCDPSLDYHEPWVNWGTYSYRDAIGRRAPSVFSPRWVQVRCNNSDCPATAWVPLSLFENMVGVLVRSPDITATWNRLVESL